MSGGGGAFGAPAMSQGLINAAVMSGALGPGKVLEALNTVVLDTLPSTRQMSERRRHTTFEVLCGARGGKGEAGECACMCCTVFCSNTVGQCGCT